jgi:hypothetical protein
VPAKKRLMALVLAGVALTLTVVGVVLAATDPNPGGVMKDPFTLNGYPPKTADLSVTLTSDEGFGLSATVQANFTTGRVAADVSFPLDVETAAFNLRLAKDHLYARSADESSGPWLVTHLSTPSLFGVSLELTKPDVDLIKGFHKMVTKNGYLTTYTFDRRGVALSKLFGSKSSNATLGSVHWSITVGTQGELVSSALRETTSKGTMTLSATVLSYNQPASISVPTAGETQRLSSTLLKKLLHSEDFTSIVFPKSLTSLSGTSVS